MISTSFSPWLNGFIRLFARRVPQLRVSAGLLAVFTRCARNHPFPIPAKIPFSFVHAILKENIYICMHQWHGGVIRKQQHLIRCLVGDYHSRSSRDPLLLVNKCTGMQYVTSGGNPTFEVDALSILKSISSTLDATKHKSTLDATKHKGQAALDVGFCTGD